MHIKIRSNDHAHFKHVFAYGDNQNARCQQSDDKQQGQMYHNGHRKPTYQRHQDRKSRQSVGLPEIDLRSAHDEM